MRLQILFFGVLKDICGTDRATLDLPAESSVHDVMAHYAAEFPKIKNMLGSLAVSVNQKFAPMDAILNSGDEVGILPPVSGGAPRSAIVRDRIDSQLVLQNIRRPEDGAVTSFEGIVRNQTRGRKTLFLDYEAYEAMALQQMEGLAQQALQQFQVRDVAIVHRLGRLQIGETSVLIVVASAHRAAAFEACRWLIDTLKKTVPIWKKEHFEDGAVWADGEPFPAEIPRASGSPNPTPASK